MRGQGVDAADGVKALAVGQREVQQYDVEAFFLEVLAGRCDRVAGREIHRSEVGLGEKLPQHQQVAWVVLYQ